MKECVQEQAAILLEVVPLIMRFIRAEARKRRGEELTVPQFRVLAYLGRNARASVSEISEFMGISMPGASLMIDVLVRSGLARRETSHADRRRMELTLTPAGKRIYQNARRAALERLSSILSTLSQSALDRITESLNRLKVLFLNEIEIVNSNHRKGNGSNP